MAIQDYGSNYQFYDKKITPNIKRSSFKLDYLNNMTCSQGLLIPYRLIHTLPNSEYNLELESLLRAINVPKVLLQSRQRVFFHEYHVSYQQLWPSWSTFMSKGVSGNTVLKLPKIRFCISGDHVQYLLKSNFNVKSSTDLVDADSPKLRNSLLNLFGLGFGSLSDYLGFPTPNTIHASLDDIFTNLKTNFDSYATDKSRGAYVDFPAFPFFAYFSIFRNFYLNWNLNVNNKGYFPDNINDFALINPDISSDGDNIFFASFTNAISYDFSRFYNNSGALSPLSQLSFGLIKNRNFVDDYFSSALPWPMRGNIPEISIDGSASLDNIPVGIVENDKFNPLSGSFYKSDEGDYSTIVNELFSDSWYITNQIKSDGSFPYRMTGLFTGFDGTMSTTTNYSNSPLVTGGNSSVTFSSGFTWEMIRNLSISTMIAEKMARTNGSYREFIRTFFDDTPSNQINNVPRYIGGHVQPIVYTEVLQQSSDSNTPLGTVGAKGVTASDGYIGKCYSNDFGLIIGILSIMPDTYYSQGLRRQDLYEVQEDFFLPERSELGMQGIYKGELFFSGDAEDDLDLFGYQNRYDEYRYRPNEVHGQLANPESLSFFPFTQSRYFTNHPVLSNEFVSTANNIRRDYLTAIDEVDFVAQIACRCTAIQPMPYKSIPVGLK